MTLHDDEFLSEIGSALSVDHGPAFAAGVHARIRQSRRRRFAVGGALALAASAMLAVWVSRPEPAPIGVPAPAVEASALTPRPSYGGAPSGQDLGRDVARAGSQARVGRTTRPASTAAPAAVASAPTQEYVVVTNQGAVLEEMWRAARGRQVQEVTAEKAVVADLPSAPIVIEPVQVAPVVIGDRAPVPAVGVVPIIRRAFAAAETR